MFMRLARSSMAWCRTPGQGGTRVEKDKRLLERRCPGRLPAPRSPSCGGARREQSRGQAAGESPGADREPTPGAAAAAPAPPHPPPPGGGTRHLSPGLSPPPRPRCGSGDPPPRPLGRPLPAALPRQQHTPRRPRPPELSRERAWRGRAAPGAILERVEGGGAEPSPAARPLRAGGGGTGSPPRTGTRAGLEQAAS